LEQDVHNTIKDLTELASSLSAELEQALLQKQANDGTIEDLRKQLTQMKKLADTNEREKVILEKVASHGIASPALIPVLGKLEKAGFIKAGSAMAAFEGIKRRPDHLVDLLSSIADSFVDELSEGVIEKRASEHTLPTVPTEAPKIDVDGWSRIITEGA
jgi:hypothetical protein